MTSVSPIVCYHLPEWRDSYAITNQIGLSLKSGYTRIHLTGARGDRLLLAGLEGPWAAEIRIDGNVGTEFARDLNAPNLFVVINGSAGAGAGYGMREGHLIIKENAGALLGSLIEGGHIWVLGQSGPRIGYRSVGGHIYVSGEADLHATDRSLAKVNYVPGGSQSELTLAMDQHLQSMADWPVA